MQKILIFALFAIVFVGLVALGAMPQTLAQEQEDECEGPPVRAYSAIDGQALLRDADGGEPTGIFMVYAEPVCVLTANQEQTMVQVQLEDEENSIGWVPVNAVQGEQPAIQPTAVPQPTTAAVENAPAVNGEANEDGDGQGCTNDLCSFDVGVNEYPDPSTTAQIGMAWGSMVGWDGNVTDGDYGFVILMPGFYLDLTMTVDGGYLVYNYPKSWSAEQVRAMVMSVAAEELAGTPLADAPYESFPVWDSEQPSLSGSAMGDEGYGPGDEYPQLDGQDFSCYPQMGTCDLNITVAETRQIGIVFGKQIGYGGLEGLQDVNNPELSTRDTDYRCDMVVLAPGVYPNLTIEDGRVEVYTVPEFDQAGWFRTLVSQRIVEQAGNYGCPLEKMVPVWNADGTTTEAYFLRILDDGTSMLEGPRNVEEFAAG